MLNLSYRVHALHDQIRVAKKALEQEYGASPETKEAVRRLSERSESLIYSLDEKSKDPDDFLVEIDELEELADDVIDKAREDKVEHMIEDRSFLLAMDAHNSISDLKVDMHRQAYAS